MKKINIYLLILLLITGCGGGGSGGSSKNLDFPSDNIGNTAYNTWEYITPNTNLNGESIESRNINGNNYNATFRNISPDTKIEIPINTNGESIEYQKLYDSIKIIFRKNNQEVYSYKMKKELHIGDTTTIDDSSCELVNHFDTYKIGTNIYYDVIEIDCGKHRGFYAKGKGEIYKD